MSIAVSTVPTPYIHSSQKRRKNTWYSIRSGNWSDPNTWMSNALSYAQWNFNYPGEILPSVVLSVIPQIGDDVYIGFGHTVTFDLGVDNNSTIQINNLYVAGTLTSDGPSRALLLNGNIQAAGTVDFTGCNIDLILRGANNYINTFVSGTSSTVTYARKDGYDQPIMDLSYRNLRIWGQGTKYLTANMTLAGALILTPSYFGTDLGSPVFELGNYNLTVNGTTTTANSTISKTGSGSMIFVGSFDGSSICNFNLTGNPTVEFRSNFYEQATSSASFVSGTGTWSFTTSATLNIRLYSQIYNFDCPVVIGAGVNAVFQSTGNGSWNVNQYIEGIDGTSTFTNQGRLVLRNATYPIPMTLNGVFVYNVTSTSYVEYAFNGNYTLPYTSYQNLGIAGTGTKTLLGDTTLSNALYVGGITGTNGYGILELSIFNFTVNGTTNFTGGASSGNQPTLSKNSPAGLVLLIGALLSQVNNQTFNFSGNPNIELRGGGTVFGSWATCNMGTGTLSFTTNNQNFDFGASASKAVLSCNILISGAITVTFTNNRTLTVTGTINGNNASSVLDNRAATHYQNATAPMVTGLLYCNQATNTWFYDLAGNQDIQPPSDPTTPGYKNLTLAGSGAKRLLGNVSVKGTYTLTSPATLDSNGFTLSNP